MHRQHGGAQVFRITGARTGLQEDVRGRQRRYVISMTIRTISVILAASLWNVERHVAAVALVLGVVLPYVAVVIANAGREKTPALPPTFVTAPMRPVIGPPGTGAGDGDGDGGPGPGADAQEPPAKARPEGRDGPV